MTWCVSFWSSGSRCVATLALSSRPVDMCTGDPTLMYNCGISCPGRGDLESMSGTGIFLRDVFDSVVVLTV